MFVSKNSMKKTRRVKIVTGLKCNIQCVFCYYRDNLNTPNRTQAEIIHDLEYARRHGITEVDLSGGEPTVHPRLPELIAKAREIGMERVCIISNGLRLADRSYLKELKAAGLDEVLFSVHGSNENVHDQITNVQGSFKKISAALFNAAAEGLNVRTNTVVNRMNYEDLSSVSRFVVGFSPVQVNFITINDWCFAKHLVDRLMLPYSEMSGRLKEACDLLDGSVKAVNVRYIPFCFMDGYERFVCNQKQLPFDPFEWVPRVRARLEVQNTLRRYLGILAYGFVAGGVYKRSFTMSLADIMDDSVLEALRMWYYKKHTKCRECRFYNICDGVENTYAKKYGLDELAFVPGQKLTNPVHFRQPVVRASL